MTTGPVAGATPARRLSINRWTARATPISEFLAACTANGVGSVGLWRQDVAEHGMRELRALVDDAGLAVSTLCRGGWFTAADADDRQAALDDNRRAIDECMGLGTDVLVLVPGGLSREDTDIAGARQRVAENIAALVPHAQQAGVRLAIEPMHPMFAADRGVVATLHEALDIAEASGSDLVGAVVDTYHVWWDPALASAITRAAETNRLLCYQVCDWNLPLAAEPLFSRGYMGDGFVDFPAITTLIRDAGYTGDIEVEIFN